MAFLSIYRKKTDKQNINLIRRQELFGANWILHCSTHLLIRNFTQIQKTERWCFPSWPKSRRHCHRTPSKCCVPINTSTMVDGSRLAPEINAAIFSHRTINSNRMINWNWSNRNDGVWDALKGNCHHFYVVLSRSHKKKKNE